ncbi:hypothetical protein P7K49_032654 [Saguinus oedipus]|uniref:Peptidase A1 domain-containing protein n=1 Tax=Saguinus oedipus TaxID=9490 RepID=A0ABQ9TYU5_SAGOE|nr:hypothetical protein P7K49_032654 [Saguinus oedipus]
MALGTVSPTSKSEARYPGLLLGSSESHCHLPLELDMALSSELCAPLPAWPPKLFTKSSKMSIPPLMSLSEKGLSLTSYVQQAGSTAASCLVPPPHTSPIPEFSDGFWTGSQLACWTNSETPWSYFPKISIYLRDENSSRSFRLTILPQLYIQPMMGAGLNYECYRFGISPSTNALVIGATVMEGFYVVFDRARKRVGFAASPCADLHSDMNPDEELPG